MRSVVLSARIRHLLKMSSMGVLGALVAGCSSGFQRFDSSVYDDATPKQTAQNPYPGNLDETTTASTGRRLVPLNPVAPNPVPQGVYHNPEPTYANNPVAHRGRDYQQPGYQQAAIQQPVYRQPVYQPPAYEPPRYQQPAAQPVRQPLVTYTPPKPDYQPASIKPRQISSTSLSKPKVTAPKITRKEAPLTYTPPKPDAVAAHIPPAVADHTKTASIQSASEREGGWTSAGGTAITVREGETLYNLSKRYGVPVAAIRSANGFSPTDGLKANQRIIIPNYIFSQNSAVSAPDNNPMTRAASAGTGFIGEARTANVGIPVKRPAYYTAAVENGAGTIVGQDYPNTVSISRADQPYPSGNTTRISQSGPAGGTYTVQSGDNLSKIAVRSGTTVAALQQANNLTGTSIRIGQKLVVPGGYDRTFTGSVRQQGLDIPPGVDPIITGSLKNKSGKLATADVDIKTPAPERSGISQFRWPVKGRVVEEFGSSTRTGKNEGIDISVPEGTAVRAAENGVVIYAGNAISSYGNLILVRHDDDWVSAYAHNRDFEVRKGDKIRRGQIIARSGKTGDAERPKLHFELRRDSRPVNPRKFLAGA